MGEIMHEMAIVRNVVDTVLEEADRVGATEVKSVHLKIGNGRDIIKEYFDKLFTFLAQGTVAENAQLNIEWIPMTACCNTCSSVFPVDRFKRETWVCPSCKAERNYVIHSGMEFSISYIEILGKQKQKAAS